MGKGFCIKAVTRYAVLAEMREAHFAERFGVNEVRFPTLINIIIFPNYLNALISIMARTKENEFG